jgi:uncharacterized protein
MANGGSGLATARPVVQVADSDNNDLTAGLLSLVIVEAANGLYRCEAVFGNWGSAQGSTGFLYFDRRTLDFGQALRIKTGGDTLFDGRITAIEARFPEGAPPQIGVLAEDRLQDLRMTRRTRSFADMSDQDVFRQIASDHGLTPSIDVDTTQHKALAQVNQSDLAFLRERAFRTDAKVWVEGATLHAIRGAGGTGAQPLELTMGGRLREFMVTADLAHQRTAVTAGGWDVSGKSALSSEAGASAISSELDGGDSGASILSAKIGDRKEALAHGVPHTSAEADAQAQAWFRTISRRFVVGRGLAETDPKLRVGERVELKGLGPLFNGKYHLASVRHLFDAADGLRTEFTAERPSLGKP